MLCLPHHHRSRDEDYMYIRNLNGSADRLASLPSDELFPMLNVGSATEECRTIMQPVDRSEYLCSHPKARGKVYHLDMKEGRGVDIVGDLLDREFLDQIAQMKVR